MTRNYNIVGGGANTNLSGLKFERGTDLREAFTNHEKYRLSGDSIIDIVKNQPVGRLYEKNKLYRNLLATNGINYKDIISTKLLPDEALLVGDTLYIIEKKYQASPGSVDEKLQTCHFKKRQYEKLMTPLAYKVNFYYLLSEWFNRPSYRDVLNYIEEVGCKYFFSIIPLEELGL